MMRQLKQDRILRFFVQKLKAIQALISGKRNYFEDLRIIQF
jgi:hypothetical protein